MDNFLIITEATSDVTYEIAEKCGLDYVIPMHFSVNGKEYLDYPDNRDMDLKEFYQHVRNKEEVHTSALNIDDANEAIINLLKEGKNVLYLVFSSGLSNTYQNVKIAVSELDENLAGKIKIVDTKMASLGEGLLAYYCSQMRTEGKSFQEVSDWAEENATKIAAHFTVNDLFHLKRGGRVSATTAILGSALNIKPILHVDDKGHLINIDKVRGRKASLDKIVTLALASRSAQDNEIILIGHGDCIDDAEYVKEQLLKQTKLKKDNIVIGYIGPSIGTHAGPGTIAVFTLATAR